MRRSLLLLAAFIATSVAVTTPGRAAVSVVAPLRLQWQVERNLYTPDAPDGRSQALLSIATAPGQGLPPGGWAIYFNCLAGVEVGALDGHLVLEQVVGTLYRLRPTSGFPGIGAGRSLDVRFLHPEVILNSTRALAGPYLVLDGAPAAGLAIEDFAVVVPTGREPRHGAPPTNAGLTTAAAIYARNAPITRLPPASVPLVFPTPKSSERRAGSLHWSGMPTVSGDAQLQPEVELLQSMLRPYFASPDARLAQPALRLAVAAVKGEASPEAYALSIDPQGGVTITGNSPAGVARGVATLHEILPLPATTLTGIDLPALQVTDAPRFAYRGLMMDVARNFQPAATVERVLDLMARYKLNVLHLHLTDDEGWRLAIPGLPELTEVGGRRGHTLDSVPFLPAAYGSGPRIDDPHGSGHYTREQFIAILRHAAALRIAVIPEIEMPGHARAAVKAMQARSRALAQAGDPAAERFQLSDPADRSAYRSAQGYTDNVMNPALPSTYAFIEHVVAAVVAMYRDAGVPLETLHVGADEVPRGAWSASPRCADLLRREQLAGTGELWNYFQSRVAAILEKQGLRASGWEELGSRRVAADGRGRLEPNPAFADRGFTLYVWNNLDDADDLAYRLANAGYDTVLAPATRLYFDMATYPAAGEPGVHWAAYADLDAAFDYVPLDDLRRRRTDAASTPGKARLTDAGRAHVRGLEGTLFSETVRDRASLDFMLMPRMLGLAERAWAPDPEWARVTDPVVAARLHDAAWTSFVNQLGQRVLPRLDAEGAGVEYRIPPPGLARIDGAVAANHQLPGFELRYTLDGTEPTTRSPLVAGPIPARGPVRVAAFDRKGRASRSVVADGL